ncbi:alpha/beta-hydrolase [Hesseltinella vesiculosa]|uniref:Alpha/beta-hydrolase n=1 Tax=Hesseltinella vesiculosa TaxID=101127 RepID=A0A1X2GJC1_9FUNG|nr:alpha/beta-hydrolase [Hesseltinella vesiculosa]
MRAQLFTTPLRTVWNVDSHKTESLWWPAQSTQQPKTVLFFICGNPGLIEYYTHFLQAIHQTTVTLEIVGVSHLGHSLGPHNPPEAAGRVYGLQEQIDHKVACFDQLRQDNPEDTNYILMGHSMGAYVCAEVLKQRPDHRITTMIALFPTLREIALTPNGVNISRLVSTIPISVVSGAAGLAGWLPSPVRQGATWLMTGQKNASLQVTAHGLLHRSVVQNALHLAKQEMETIKALDHDFYSVHSDKFILYYSRNDQWAPPDHFDYMAEHFPNAKVHLCPQDIPHAFVLDDTHSEYIASRVVEWLKK